MGDHHTEIFRNVARRKTERREAFLQLTNALKEEKRYKGDWASYFGNSNPITLELGCGKGDLSLALAEMYPDRNFMGIDLKSPRLWVGASEAVERRVSNLCFHRLDITNLEEYFSEGEVSEIWLTFPDPFPKARHEKRRLVFKDFIRRYQKILSVDGIFHFKTDNLELFNYAIEVLDEMEIGYDHMTRDLHNSDELNADNGVTTDYERRFISMGKPICYLRSKLRN